MEGRSGNGGCGSPPTNRNQRGGHGKIVNDRESDDKERLERERRERMARLRAENDAEEKGTVVPLGGDEEPVISNRKRQRESSRSSKGSNRNEQDDNDDGSDDDEMDMEQNAMMQLMGFGGFETTKGKAVKDNQSSAARGSASKNTGRKYRQYMNRKGGFNRPLDKML